MKKTRASIALISLLVISAFTLVLALGMSEVNISKSYQYFNNTANKSGYYIAEACLEESIIRLEDDTSYTGGTLTFNADTNCTISVAGTGNTRTITLSANTITHTQTFQASIDLVTNGQANNANLSDWNEI